MSGFSNFLPTWNRTTCSWVGALCGVQGQLGILHQRDDSLDRNSNLQTLHIVDIALPYIKIVKDVGLLPTKLFHDILHELVGEMSSTSNLLYSPEPTLSHQFIP